MKTRKQTTLPIGRAAVLAFQICALRQECCKAADRLVRQKRLDEAELEDCARLDDALADAHRVLRSALTRLTLARLKRRAGQKRIRDDLA